ncbi:MAG: multidrug efflux RND transporter periplasmic adaptor subunit MexJ [Alphaproteobacteria bacterium]
MLRRYPGILEPAEVNTLSFNVGGRVGEIGLVVGQDVSRGDLLAEIDPQTFILNIETSAAAVDEAEAAVAQSRADLDRSQRLLDRGVATVTRRDQDATALRTNEARLVQAQKSLATAEEQLAESKLYAPFDGVINSVDVEGFSTVGAGQGILSMYSEGTYEVAFSVSFEVASQIKPGLEATVHLDDLANSRLKASVSELGERAETVSVFPVVVSLDESNPNMRPGMAVDVELALNIGNQPAVLVPITATITSEPIEESDVRRQRTRLFVFDPETETLQAREVVSAGVRGNQLMIVEGLAPGERVATKGVSFLRDGMKVKLMPGAER